MKKCEMPCFDCWYIGASDEDYSDIVCECLCGSEDTNECTHLNGGGTWEDCLSGGEFKYLKEYRDRCAKSGYNQEDHKSDSDDHSVPDECLGGGDLDEEAVDMASGGRVVTKGGNPFMLLEDALRDDPEYAWGWHCNFAMCIKDNSNLSHAESNRIAAKIMDYFFSIDITKNPCWDNKWDVGVISDCGKGCTPVDISSGKKSELVGILWDSGKKRLVERSSGSDLLPENTLDFGNKTFVYEVLRKDALGCDSWQRDRVFEKALLGSLLKDVLNGDSERIYREIPEEGEKECSQKQIPAPTNAMIIVPKEYGELASMGCLGIEEPFLIMSSGEEPITLMTEVTLCFEGDTLVKHNCYDEAPFILADDADFCAVAGNTLKVAWVCNVWKEVCRTTNNG